jgi:hypothetical protein
MMGTQYTPTVLDSQQLTEKWSEWDGFDVTRVGNDIVALAKELTLRVTIPEGVSEPRPVLVFFNGFQVIQGRI